MGIRFLCSTCGHKLNVKSFLAGKRGVCPQCGVGLDIPMESQIQRDGSPRDDDDDGKPEMAAAATAVPAVAAAEAVLASSIVPAAPQAAAAPSPIPVPVRPAVPMSPSAIPAAVAPVPLSKPAAAPVVPMAAVPAAPTVPVRPGPAIGTAKPVGLAGGSANPAALPATPFPNLTGNPVTASVAPVATAAFPAVAAQATPAAAAPLHVAPVRVPSAPGGERFRIATPVSAAPVSAAPVALAPGRPFASNPIDEAPEAVWYVRPPAGGQYGPARGEVMRKWMTEGRVSGDSLVWREGWDDWRNAIEVFPTLGGPAVPPAPNPVMVAPAAHAYAAASPRRTVSPASMRMARRKNSTTLAIVAVVILGLMSVALLVTLFVLIQK